MGDMAISFGPPPRLIHRARPQSDTVSPKVEGRRFEGGRFETIEGL